MKLVKSLTEEQAKYSKQVEDSAKNITDLSTKIKQAEKAGKDMKKAWPKLVKEADLNDIKNFNAELQSGSDNIFDFAKNFEQRGFARSISSDNS